MSEHDEPIQPPEAQPNVTELRSFVRQKKAKGELANLQRDQSVGESLENPEEYTDPEFADYMLSKWAHPSSLDIMTTIAVDVTPDETTPDGVAARIITIIDPSHFTEQAQPTDATAASFIQLQKTIADPLKKETLTVVWRLYKEATKDDPAQHNVLSHLEVIVNRILHAE